VIVVRKRVEASWSFSQATTEGDPDPGDLDDLARDDSLP
jgi:hypothetical protein